MGSEGCCEREPCGGLQLSNFTGMMSDSYDGDDDGLQDDEEDKD